MVIIKLFLLFNLGVMAGNIKDNGRMENNMAEASIF